jgi:hypothetical protein
MGATALTGDPAQRDTFSVLLHCLDAQRPLILPTVARLFVLRNLLDAALDALPATATSSGPVATAAKLSISAATTLRSTSSPMSLIFPSTAASPASSVPASGSESPLSVASASTSAAHSARTRATTTHNSTNPTWPMFRHAGSSNVAPFLASWLSGPTRVHGLVSDAGTHAVLVQAFPLPNARFFNKAQLMICNGRSWLCSVSIRCLCPALQS